ATSSVDTRTELLVQHAMAALRTDRTSFVIAHRLSTIRDADLILVMESGAIVEQGTHDELLAAEGAYAALYRSQFAAASAEEAVVRRQRARLEVGAPGGVRGDDAERPRRDEAEAAVVRRVAEQPDHALAQCVGRAEDRVHQRAADPGPLPFRDDAHRAQAQR